MGKRGSFPPLTGADLRPGYVLRHWAGGMVTIDRRKDDDSGWWNDDGSGLSDYAVSTGDWEQVKPVPAAREVPGGD